jgi:hypothetical protein
VILDTVAVRDDAPAPDGGCCTKARRCGFAVDVYNVRAQRPVRLRSTARD